jgi:hypothetical protein
MLKREWCCVGVVLLPVPLSDLSISLTRSLAPNFQVLVDTKKKGETRTKAERLCVPCNPIMGYHSESPSPPLLRFSRPSLLLARSLRLVTVQ